MAVGGSPGGLGVAASGIPDAGADATARTAAGSDDCAAQVTIRDLLDLLVVNLTT